MKLSTKVRYGVRSLIMLNTQNHTQLSVNTIAQNQEISQNYLENIFSKFKKAGFIVSEKGAKGGYRLAIDPTKISLFDIVEALDRDTEIIVPTKKELLVDVLNEMVYQPLNNEVITYLKSVTLADIENEDEENLLIM